MILIKILTNFFCPSASDGDFFFAHNAIKKYQHQIDKNGEPQNSMNAALKVYDLHAGLQA